MDLRQRITDLAQSLTADPESQDSRTRGGGVWGDGINYDDPDEQAIEDFRKLYRTNPFIRESVRTFVSEILEPGYQLEADDQTTIDDLEEWAESCAIVGGQMDQDLQLLLEQIYIDLLVAGSAPIEHVTAEEDEDALTALKLIKTETLKAYKRPGQNILVRPDDVDADWAGDYPTTDEDELAAFVQFDDALGFKERDENRFTTEDVTLLTRDRETGSVWGQSICKPVKGRAEAITENLDDVHQAVQTMGHPHRYVKFGDEEHPWDYEDEIKPYMQQYEPGNFEPGQSSGGPADVEIEQYSGEVPSEILDIVKSDVNVVMSAMPIPKYELGGFEENINQFVSQSQENKQNLQISEARRKLEAALTPIFKEKAEQLDLDPAGLRLKIETPEDEGADQGDGEGEDTGAGDDPDDGGDDGSDDPADTPDDVDAADMALWPDAPDVDDLADPRFVSTEAEVRELRSMLADVLQGARDRVLDRLETRARRIDDLAADREGRRIAAQLEQAAQSALQAYLAEQSVPEEARPILRQVVEQTIEKLNSDTTAASIEASFGVVDEQAIEFYTDNVENQISDATDDMVATIRTQVRRGIEEGLGYPRIRDRIEEQIDDATLQQRAGLIARMETQNAIQGTRLREYERSDVVIGVGLINPCGPNTTRLCRHLAGCGPLEGALAYFEDGPLSEQWMEQAPADTLFDGFTPLPPSPPFHWHCRTGMVPLTERVDRLADLSDDVLEAALVRIGVLDVDDLAAAFEPNEWVTYGDDNRGVVLEIIEQDFEFGGEAITASSEEPAYIVARETGGSAPFRDDELEATESPSIGAEASPEQLAEEADLVAWYDEVDDPHAVTDLTIVPGVDDPGIGFDSWPDSWEKADEPARLIALDAWTSMGATFDGCVTELGSPRLCGAFKDEIYGWTGWRGLDDLSDDWTPALHPRNDEGKFREKVGMTDGGLDLDAAIEEFMTNETIESEINRVKNVDDDDLDRGFTLGADLTEYDGGGTVATITSRNVKTDELTKEEIVDVVQKYRESIEAFPETAAIGTWNHEGEDRIAIDVNAIVDSREQAVELGRRNDQAYVWDLDAGESIKTGGTGEEAAEKDSDEVLREFREVVGDTEGSQ